jgi:hypothetical protein
VDLLFGCVEGEVANIERCRVLELVLGLRAGAAIVVVAVSSALLVGRVSTCACVCVRALGVEMHLRCGIRAGLVQAVDCAPERRHGGQMRQSR